MISEIINFLRLQYDKRLKTQAMKLWSLEWDPKFLFKTMLICLSIASCIFIFRLTLLVAARMIPFENQKIVYSIQNPSLEKTLIFYSGGSPFAQRFRNNFYVTYNNSLLRRIDWDPNVCDDTGAWILYDDFIYLKPGEKKEVLVNIYGYDTTREGNYTLHCILGETEDLFDKRIPKITPTLKMVDPNTLSPLELYKLLFPEPLNHTYLDFRIVKYHPDLLLPEDISLTWQSNNRIWKDDVMAPEGIQREIDIVSRYISLYVEKYFYEHS